MNVCMKIGLLTLSAGCLAVLATGCVEHRVVYVPTYQAPPGYYATPASPPPQVVVAQPPPAPRVEVIPAPPSPAYVWLPGYWSLGAGGGWVWVGGHYAARPRPNVAYYPGHWARHSHGYIWVGGYWR